MTSLNGTSRSSTMRSIYCRRSYSNWFAPSHAASDWSALAADRPARSPVVKARSTTSKNSAREERFDGPLGHDVKRCSIASPASLRSCNDALSLTNGNRTEGERMHSAAETVEIDIERHTA